MLFRLLIAARVLVAAVINEKLRSFRAVIEAPCVGRNVPNVTFLTPVRLPTLDPPLLSKFTVEIAWNKAQSVMLDKLCRAVEVTTGTPLIRSSVGVADRNTPSN